MIKKIFLFISIFFLFSNSSFWVYISPKVQKLFDNLVIKIQKENDLESQKNIFLNLNKKFESFKTNRKYKNNEKFLDVLNQVSYLSKERIKQIEEEIKKENIDYNNEKKEEILEDILEENDKLKTYKQEYVLEKERRKKIIESYSYSKYFKNISYTKKHIFLEDWVWKAYSFKSYSFFPKGVNVSKRDLDYNWVNLETDLLFVTKKDEIWFVKNPKKVMLIKDDLVKNLDNKYYFLEEVLDDVRNSPNSSYDYYFEKLKKKTKDITNNLSTKSKIQNIYNYILKNTSYSKVIDFDNYKIFSGIETFKNKDWVCEWYAKLMVYMLMFAWISDVEVIRWYVIDADDFPDVWHAWVRVWDRYYDPTFDDPVWAIDDKQFRDYKYFNLPKDLSYTNRYDEEDLPESVRNMSLENREEMILYNLNEIVKSGKYKGKNYKLLKLIEFKKEHKIDYNEKITLDNFSRILPMYSVKDFSFTKNSSKKYISKLRFYDISSTDIEKLINQIWYDLSWYYLFKFYEDNWRDFKYVLAYDVEFR